MDIPPIDGTLPYYSASAGSARNGSKYYDRKDYSNNKNRGMDYGGHYSNDNDTNKRGKWDSERNDYRNDYRNNYGRSEYDRGNSSYQNRDGRFNKQKRNVYNDNYDEMYNHQSSLSYHK